MWIGPHASIGTPSEIRGGPHPSMDEGGGAGVEIGARTVVREFVVVNQGSTVPTIIGADCYLMDNVHVPHDALVGDRSTMAPNVAIAGHCWFGVGVNLGMGAAFHQFGTVGAHAMVGMNATVTRPIPPFAVAYGSPARVAGANRVGLARLGVDEVIWDLNIIGTPPSETSFGKFFQRLDGRARFQAMVDAFDSPGFDALAMTDAILDGELPAANGLFTARSLARMYAGLVSPDAFDAPPLLTPETVDRMTRVQTRERDAVVGVKMKWRLGYHFTATLKGEIPTGFGHFGYGGSGAWGDPASGLAVAFVVNRVAGTPFADGRFVRVGTAAVSAAARTS